MNDEWRDRSGDTEAAIKKVIQRVLEENPDAEIEELKALISKEVEDTVGVKGFTIDAFPVDKGSAATGLLPLIMNIADRLKEGHMQGLKTLSFPLQYYIDLLVVVAEVLRLTSQRDETPQDIVKRSIVTTTTGLYKELRKQQGVSERTALDEVKALLGMPTGTTDVYKTDAPQGDREAEEGEGRWPG